MKTFIVSVLLVVLVAAEDTCPPSTIVSRKVPLVLLKEIHSEFIPAVCDTMNPWHKFWNYTQIPEQTSEGKYEVLVSKTSVLSGAPIVVTLAGVGCQEFLGVFVKASSGKFEDKGDGHSLLITCYPYPDIGAAYYSESPIRKVEFTWRAPDDFSDYDVVVFTATFVRKFDEFWLGIKSENVTVKQRPPRNAIEAVKYFIRWIYLTLEKRGIMVDPIGPEAKGKVTILTVVLSIIYAIYLFSLLLIAPYFRPYIEV